MLPDRTRDTVLAAALLVLLPRYLLGCLSTRFNNQSQPIKIRLRLRVGYRHRLRPRLAERLLNVPNPGLP